MGTTVQYNDVTLHNVVTREWNQDVHYDESHTDVLYHTFRLRFEGILHAESAGTVWVGTDANQDSMIAQHRDVQSRICQSRGELSVTVSNANGSTGDETEIFHCNPSVGDPSVKARLADPDRDVDNGPKPVRFQVLQVIGAKCLRVAFEIECAKLVCRRGTYSGNGAGLPVVLSNRWSVSEDMDENHFITRNISGRLRLSAAVAAGKTDAKWLVVPGLETGFRRAAIDFSTDKTGLECEYRISDRQVHTAAPWPATKMDARHTQSTVDGLKMSSEMHVRLKGPPHADKKLLLVRAIQVIDAKLNFKKASTKEGYAHYFPEHVSITDMIGDENVVEATVKFLETPATDQVGQMFAGLRDNMGKPLDKLPNVTGQPRSYDPKESTPPAVYGYVPHAGERKPTILLLLQCYLQQPCVDQHGIAKWGTAKPSDEDDDESKKRYEPELRKHPEGSLKYQPKDQWSDSAKNHLYTFARMSTTYLTNECRVQLPIARSMTDESTKPTDPTCQTFRLAPPQCRRVIEMDVERAGVWPEIIPPHDEYIDGVPKDLKKLKPKEQKEAAAKLKGTLLRHWIEPHPPSLTADGVTRLYRITAYYVYAMNRPPLGDEKFSVGVAPQTKYKCTDPEVQFDPAQAYNNKFLGP